MFNIEEIRPDLEQLNWLYLFDHHSTRRNHCIYCGEDFKLQRKLIKTRDHLIPRSKLKEANHVLKSRLYSVLIVPSCSDCNTLKGSKSLLEFQQYLKSNWCKNRILILCQLDYLIIK